MGMYCALFGRFDSDPTRESCYKDAITIPHYVERSRAYAGTQRMGIRDERPGALSICAHVRGAMEAPFFCAQEADSNPPPTTAQLKIQFILFLLRMAKTLSRKFKHTQTRIETQFPRGLF